jgi:GNAT superfamily N-acetyltransferase
VNAGKDAARQAFEREVTRQRRNGTPLREQLLWRIEALTSGQSIDLGEHIEDFPEVRKAFSIPYMQFGLAPGKCVASLEDGGYLKLIGYLYTETPTEFYPVAEFKRKVYLDQQYADHRWLKVEPPFRGRGLSSALLLRSFDFYRDLGLNGVELEAGMETGKWHWARVGFEFMLPEQREKVRGWAIEVTEALNLGGLKIETFSAATQFARMEGSRDVSLAEIADALPALRQRIDVEVVAEKNGLEMDQPIALGRAVMLTGPPWEGHLELHGPSYAAFKSYADAKREEGDKRPEEPE